MTSNNRRNFNHLDLSIDLRSRKDLAAQMTPQQREERKKKRIEVRNQQRRGYSNEVDEIFSRFHRISIRFNIPPRINPLPSRVGYQVPDLSLPPPALPPIIEEETPIEGSEKCVICLDKKPSILFESCSHLCICHACLEAWVGPFKCPICRKEGKIRKVYFS